MGSSTITKFAVLGSLLLALFITPAWAEKTELRIQLQWQHQAQFAGLYMAEERGYFEDEGLSVTLIEGGPGVNPLTELEEGRVDAAISWLANQHSHHTNEAVSTINVAQILNIPSLVVLCRLETGVLRAEDLKGQRIGIWDLGDKAIVK